MRLRHIAPLIALGALALGGPASSLDVVAATDDQPEPRKPREEPKAAKPDGARRTITPADEERIRAAEMKRARKAAKRHRDQSRQENSCD